VKERRGGHVGTISGLALLVGSTALAAVAGGRHSIFATLLLGLLATGLGHSLYVELGRQARRRSAWNHTDTINTGVLAACGGLGLAFLAGPAPVRAVGLTLSLAYAVSCGYFVTERRRSLSERRGLLGERRWFARGPRWSRWFARGRRGSRWFAPGPEWSRRFARGRPWVAGERGRELRRQDHDDRRDRDAVRLDRQLGSGQPVEAEGLRPEAVVGAQAWLAVGDRHGEN
jgi:hypothetical protein